MNPLVLASKVQQYLEQHKEADLSRFVLSGSPFEGISVQEMAQQLEGRRKTRGKLPTWHRTKGIYFPPKINLEQTSSELTAAYKANLIYGNSLLDLTGGLGVDTYFFSKKFNQVDYCEINTSLAHIAAHNFERLNAENITVHALNGIDFLKGTSNTYDCIFIDPSRRNSAKGKVFLLKDCEPDLPENLELLLAKAERIIVKTSPLLDIQAALTALSGVIEIHCIAVKNEVKELLFVLKNGSLPSEISLLTINSTAEENEKTSVNYRGALQAEAVFGAPRRYLYEPNAALMKSGLFNWVSAFYKLDKLHPNTQLYSSDKLIAFPGRRFEIIAKFPYAKAAMKKLLHGKKANITTRNFKETVPQLRKKFKLIDGGERYLFFTTCTDGKQWVLDCIKTD